MPPKPPCSVQPCGFPVFCIQWFAQPDGRSIVVFGGGGGSARTGVFNSIVIRDSNNLEDIKINTGEQIGLAVYVYENPHTQTIWILASLCDRVCRYSLEGTLSDTLEWDDLNPVGHKWTCETVTMNATADRMAIGMDNGTIKVYDSSEDNFASRLLFVCNGHEKAITTLSFSMKNQLLLSAAKDGTARVWDSTGNCTSVMKCDCKDGGPPKKRPQQILVRGCAWLDMDGMVAVTVASPRRGKAFLFRWHRQPDGTYAVGKRSCISKDPVSSFSLAADGELLAMGNTEGMVLLWSMASWKLIRSFPEIHGLPVQCIAARPYAIPLHGEEDGIAIHARTGSGDSSLGLVTLQKKSPDSRSSSAGGFGIWSFFSWIFWLVLFAAVAWPLSRDIQRKCESQWGQGFVPFRTCVVEEVFWAPSTRIGVDRAPY